MDDLMGRFSKLMAYVGDVFADVEAAEEEIAAAQKRHPSHAAAIWDAFPVCQRSRVLREAPELAYRIHLRCLLDRVAAGEDLRPATDGEVLAVLSALSLEHPLRQDAAALYECLMIKHTSYRTGESPLSETYTGAVEELLAQLRRKLSVKRRWPAWAERPMQTQPRRGPTQWLLWQDSEAQAPQMVS